MGHLPKPRNSWAATTWWKPAMPTKRSPSPQESPGLASDRSKSVSCPKNPPRHPVLARRPGRLSPTRGTFSSPPGFWTPAVALDRLRKNVAQLKEYVETTRGCRSTAARDSGVFGDRPTPGGRDDGERAGAGWMKGNRRAVRGLQSILLGGWGPLCGARAEEHY